ncbi:hypothetical protein C5615_38875 [Burkholderia cepacia]|uniref:Uncharacterized protein n=1 Tax=Burkholderia cepacia TaxID=292 RepID=A0A2S8HQG0_BURCE|nr:hypothetical protein [Burkholderia cepacia]PQP04625.1 hypothetical protein C5615_38875 [Burkholderia cepacia]HDR9512299.1 hypothetical protein [Burkholderia cepacia]
MKYLIIVFLLAIAYPYWGDRLRILSSSHRLLILRKLGFDHFDFPRWHSMLAVISASLSPVYVAVIRHLEFKGLAWIPPATAVCSMLLFYPVYIAVLRWWMRRGERYDGRGSLFNLLISSQLVLTAFYIAADATFGLFPVFYSIPYSLYAILVTGNALSGAIPKATLGYSIAGVVIATILSTLVVFNFQILMLVAEYFALLQPVVAPS